MHKFEFCHNILSNALPLSVHAKRRDSLTRFVSSLLNYDIKLSVTEIGKRLRSNTSIKHNIKAADYFVGNKKLAADIPSIYSGLANYFWKKSKSLVVLVDWTGACSAGYHSISASVVAHGRSLPLYHETHRACEQEQLDVHVRFLQNLKNVIPDTVDVIIITDAGFHRTWFGEVLKLGWDFIGRIYSRYSYQENGENTWKSIANINFDKHGKAVKIGKVNLGKTKQSVEGHLYSYRPRLSGKLHKKNQYPDHEKAFSNYYRKGWVIFSSLDKPASNIIRFYQKRMQIEQNFKDLKSEQYGIGLRRNKSKGLTRITILFFLGNIINLLLWWIGLMTEQAGEQVKYQANTVRTKRIISCVSLGRMRLLRDDADISWTQFRRVIKKFREQYCAFIETGFLG